ncbi:hypothetical protein NMG29_32685 [Streptomyces cocklensis]|uniref:hypothetical protein n=1 Tax=Actinacidiphila cocklensis TaxID=887465 RepID=UPI00203D84AB|nr:hypothetical protein [Actinacidiphila cocklensis]MDD1062902.1 hypothetical protein [Actinacidiphila cocklensis]
MSRTSVPQPSVLPAFEAALTREAADPREADDDLVAAVRAMDDAGESATALDLLAARPHMVLRLDGAVRRTALHRHAYAGRSGRTAAEQPVIDAAGPLGLALAAALPPGRPGGAA